MNTNKMIHQSPLHHRLSFIVTARRGGHGYAHPGEWHQRAEQGGARDHVAHGAGPRVLRGGCRPRPRLRHGDRAPGGGGHA